MKNNRKVIILDTSIICVWLQVPGKDGKTPWDAFTQQASLIGNDELKRTLNIWRETAITGQSLGDAMIVEVAKYYSNYGASVEIFTGDEGLKAYESMSSTRLIPRRRK